MWGPGAAWRLLHFILFHRQLCNLQASASPLSLFIVGAHQSVLVKKWQNAGESFSTWMTACSSACLGTQSGVVTLGIRSGCNLNLTLIETLGHGCPSQSFKCITNPVPNTKCIDNCIFLCFQEYVRRQWRVVKVDDVTQVEMVECFYSGL